MITLRRLAIAVACLFVVVVLHQTGQVFIDRSALAQSHALFIPDDSVVYQGQLTSLSAQQTGTGLHLNAAATETLSFVKTSTQVLSGASVALDVPAFQYHADLKETATGLYQATAQVDVSVQPTLDGAAPTMSDFVQWSVVPQSGTFTIGNASFAPASTTPLKISDAIANVQVINQALAALPPVSGFIPNAGVSASAAGASYQVPVSATMRAQVLDASGKPAANHRLTVTVAPDGLQAQTLAVTTDSKGFFNYDVTYPATISVSGGSLANLPAPFQLQGTTTQQVSAFWWGGGDSGGGGSSQQQTDANLSVPVDPTAQGGSDPVNIVTGNVYDVETDLSYSSPGLPVSFQRTYNSQDPRIGSLGRGWSQSFGMKIEQTQHNNQGTLTETTAGGARIVWTAIDQNGNFAPPAGVHGTLVINNGDKTYLKRDKHGVLTHYLNGDQGGLVDWIRDPNGNQTSFGYSGGQLTSVTDSAGRQVKLAYTSAGRLASVTDPLGAATSYVYNSDGMLAEADYAGGSTVRYAYDSSGNLVQIADPDGYHRLFTYDGQNRATSFTYDGGLERTSFSYNAAANKTALTDAQGFQTVYTYQFVGSSGVISRVVDPIGGVTSYTWDSDVNRTSVTDPLGHTTKMAYDGQGNLTSASDALGGTLHVQYESTFNRPTTYTDPAGHVTRIAYDAGGNPVAQTDALGNTSRYVRDSRGLLTQLTDAAGGVSKIAYDSAGDLTSIVDALGNTTSAAYDGLGHQTSVTDALGRKAQFAYGGLYRLTKVTAPDSSSVSLAYDANGNLVAVTDQLGNRSSTTYNQANQPVKVVDAAGRATTAAYHVRGLLASVTDAAGNTTAVTYSPAGDITKLIRADGSFGLQQHDAAHNLVAVTDPNGHTTRSTYDPRNLLTAVTDAMGGVTKYAYDALGEQTGVTDANGHQSLVTFDADGRVIARTDPLGHLTKYGFDAVGNQTTVTDALNQVTSFSYDALTRPVRAAYADGQVTSWSYDAVGNQAQMTDGLGTTSYTYDSLDRLVKQGLPDGTTLAFAYDAAGNRTAVATPVGTTSYAYDASRRLTALTDPAGGQTTFGYDGVGRLVTQNAPNGTTATRAYNAVGQLVQETYAGRQGASLTDLKYAYDRTGNRVSVTENSKQTTFAMDALNRLTSVGYPGGPQVKYAYDAAGNRLSQTISGLPGNSSVGGPKDEPGNGTTNYTYDAADQVVTAGSQTFSYDADGHLTSVSGPDASRTSYAWDARQLLTAVTTPDTQVRYGYDGSGRLVSRQDKGGAALQNVYDGTQLLLQRGTVGTGQGSDQSGWTAFVSGGGQALSTLRTNPAGKIDQQQFLQTDAQGSLVGITNQQGQQTSSFAYTAWGSPLGQSNAAGRGEGENDNQGDSGGSGLRSIAYAGQPFDSASGLGYFNARWYQPQTGRFISRDTFPPIPGVSSSLNRYAYALDNPSTLRDPSGRSVLVTQNQTSTTTSTSQPTKPNCGFFCNDTVAAAIGAFGSAIGFGGAVLGVAQAWTAYNIVNMSGMAAYTAAAGASVMLFNVFSLVLAVFGVFFALYADYQACGSLLPCDFLGWLGLVLAVAGIALAIAAFFVAAPFLALALAIVGLVLAALSLIISMKQLSDAANKTSPASP